MKSIFSFFLGLILATDTTAQFRGSEQQIHYRPGDWVSVSMTRYVTSIAQSHDDVYFGTTAGITRYDFINGHWEWPYTTSDGLENDRIRIVVYDFATGYLWCATDTGVSYVVPGSEKWWNAPYASLGIGPVTSIGMGRKYLWLESSGKLVKGDRMGSGFWEATTQEAMEDSVQWRGARGQDFIRTLPYLFAPEGYVFFQQGYIQDMKLRQFDITDAFQDAFFHLWLATWGLGSCAADVATFQLNLLPYGLYVEDVQAMAWDEDGSMWIGGRHPPGENGGITLWDRENNTWIYFEVQFIPHLLSDDITSIVTDTACVWFGTREGLARYDKKNNAWRTWTVFDNLWDNRVHFVALGDSVLWVGTELGINRILLPSMVVEKIEDKRLIRRRIYCLAKDGNTVWAGTDRSIFRYAGGKNGWESVSGYAGMLVDTVTAISVWRNEVWFGTNDGIEMYAKKQKDWLGFPSMHYPTQGPIHALVADSAVVWAGTERGVLKYVKREDRWRVYTTDDGLLDNSVRWILLDGDYVWFGTARGLTRFYWNAPYRID